MQPERWQQIDQLFHSALEQEPNRRAAFLVQECAGDGSLRSEVEALISSHEQAASFIEIPASDLAAELLAKGQTALKIDEVIGSYRIVSVLGMGGMGEVYLAQDTRLGRQVALKLLPAHFTMDASRVHRFEQEARAASSLNHPNIVTIHEIARADGAQFMVTEFIDGHTLREQMVESRIDLRKALDVAIQVASALEAAHAAGIVHRDIKPENIMLRRDGYVKILDFGLAKLTEHPASNIDTEAETRAAVKTNPGMVMGTASYMSPEQARGLAVDARTDVWSLGVVLYEMLAGRAPFEGETPSHVTVSILEKEPALLASCSTGVPAELEWIVNKALRKNKGERYQTASDLALDLKRLKQELEVEARLNRSVVSGREVADRDGQAVVGTAHHLTATTDDVKSTRPTSSAEYLVSEIKRHKRGAAVLVAAAMVIAVSVMAHYFYFAKGGEAIDSVAVLPLVNVGGDPNTEYLSEGISDSVINRLSQLPNLKVIALSSTMRYKGREIDPQAVGRDLNVRVVLTGRLIQRGDDISISTELVDVRDNRHLWGGQYNRKLADIMTVQTEIAQEIAQKLRLQLSGEERKRLTKRYTENSEAYQLYVMGRYFRRTRSEKGLQKSVEFFEQAIKKDPNYAPAYAGLAGTYAFLGGSGLLAPKEALQKEEWAARKALEIDSDLAEAHAAMAALVRKRDLNWSASEEEFKLALELNPNSVDAHQGYATSLAAWGRFDEAMLHLKRAEEIDPLSPITKAEIGNLFYFSRQYDRAIEQFQKIIEMDPNFAPAHNRLQRAYLAKGMYEQAITEQKKAIASDQPEGRFFRTADLGYAYAVAGKRDEAQKILDELKELAKQRYVSPSAFAVIYMGLDDKDQAFAWLEKTFEARPDNLYFLKVSPQYDGLRSDARFTDLLRHMKLSP